MKTYILAGQSNAFGVAELADLPPELSGPLSNVNVYWDGAMDPLEAGVNNNENASAFFGPEMSLMTDLATFHGEAIALVKVARGGAILDFNASYDDWSPLSSGELWDKMEADYVDAATLIPNLDVRGFIWLQGAADASIVDSAPKYKANLKTLISGVRTLTGKPALPCIVSKDPDYSGYNNFIVKEAQRQCGLEDRRVKWLETSSYPTRMDQPLHFTTQAYLDLGSAMAVIARKF